MTAQAVRAARAIDALRRGWPIIINTKTFLPIETADIDQISRFDPDYTSHILISGPRAVTLKLANQRDAADPHAAVLIARTSAHDTETLLSIADPSTDLIKPMKGPFKAQPATDPDGANAALELARLAGILPAFLVLDQLNDDTIAIVAPSDITDYQAPNRMRIAARARLPITIADKAEMVAFRSPEGGQDHVALIIGTPAPVPLVRLHSECLTGDVFGSLKCDCGPQLQAALALMERQGGGVLLYLRQEGRGIGLINKLRAYQLQDQGFDTVDANLRLGFAIDARDFGVAAHMLMALRCPIIRLLTNNPAKVDGLVASGITVAERISHSLPPNPHNAAYLATKRDRTGHAL